MCQGHHLHFLFCQVRILKQKPTKHINPLPPQINICTNHVLVILFIKVKTIS